MSKQLTGKKALSHSLLCTLLVCLTVFFLVGCDSNYTLNGSTTNGNGHQGSTTSGGSGSTNSGSGSTNSGSGSTNSGSGSTNSGSGTFQVTSVDVTVSPSSINGFACGSQFTVTYTATFHIAPNSPGGTIHFEYSTDDFHSLTPASVNVNPGATAILYQFSKTGPIHVAQYPDVFPGYGGVEVLAQPGPAPAKASPTGQCY